VTNPRVVECGPARGHRRVDVGAIGVGNRADLVLGIGREDVDQAARIRPYPLATHKQLAMLQDLAVSVLDGVAGHMFRLQDWVGFNH
jgi:hypothetical protein